VALVGLGYYNYTGTLAMGQQAAAVAAGGKGAVSLVFSTWRGACSLDTKEGGGLGGVFTHPLSAHDVCTPQSLTREALPIKPCHR